MFYLDIGILTRTTRTYKLQARDEMGIANPLRVNANVLSPPRLDTPVLQVPYPERYLLAEWVLTL
jgi:hypothetical protein